MDWFLYGNGLRHERIKASKSIRGNMAFQISTYVHNFIANALFSLAKKSLTKSQYFPVEPVTK